MRAFNSVLHLGILGCWAPNSREFQCPGTSHISFLVSYLGCLCFCPCPPYSQEVLWGCGNDSTVSVLLLVGFFPPSFIGYLSWCVFDTFSPHSLLKTARSLNYTLSGLESHFHSLDRGGRASHTFLSCGLFSSSCFSPILLELEDTGMITPLMSEQTQ